MNKILTALVAASMLLPTATLASSIRPGARVTHKSLQKEAKDPLCLVGTELGGESKKELWEECKVTIDETGVTHPIGNVTKVIQWTTEEKPFNTAGAIIGGAAGAGVGFAAGLGTCMFLGPFCLITAPAVMQSGMMVGGAAGGKGLGKYFTVVGETATGQRVIQEWYEKSGKAAAKTSKDLLKASKLVEGEID